MRLAAHIEHVGIVRRQSNSDRGCSDCQPDCYHVAYPVKYAQPAPNCRCANRHREPNGTVRDAFTNVVSNSDLDRNAHTYADTVAHAPDAHPYPAPDTDRYGNGAAVGDANACFQSNSCAHRSFWRRCS